MEHVWISSGSTTIEAMVNPIAAACVGDGIEEQFIPDTVYFLDNPGLTDSVGVAADVTRTILTQHGIKDPEIKINNLDHETDFGDIADHFSKAIRTARDGGAQIAIDVTPGRKFMSAIAFNSGTTFDVNHIFYLYIKSSEYHGRIYPNIPRTGVELYDFIEVLQ